MDDGRKEGGIKEDKRKSEKKENNWWRKEIKFKKDGRMD